MCLATLAFSQLAANIIELVKINSMAAQVFRQDPFATFNAFACTEEGFRETYQQRFRTPRGVDTDHQEVNYCVANHNIITSK
jgi:hypothetical protein